MNQIYVLIIACYFYGILMGLYYRWGFVSTYKWKMAITVRSSTIFVMIISFKSPSGFGIEGPRYRQLGGKNLGSCSHPGDN